MTNKAVCWLTFCAWDKPVFASHSQRTVCGLVGNQKTTEKYEIDDFADA